MRRILFFLIIVAVTIMNFGCSDESGKVEISNLEVCAPEQSEVANKEFRFYINPPKWAIRCLPSIEQGDGMVLVATGTLLYKPAIWYKKTGDKTAQITISFSDQSNGRGYYYEYDLQFTDAHQGRFTGICKTNQWNVILMKDVTHKVKQSGYFAFDMEDSPDFDSESSTEEETIEKIENGELFGSWLLQQADKAEYVTFRRDGIFINVIINGDKYEEKEGFYQFEEDLCIIAMLDKGSSELKYYKVSFSSNGELLLCEVAEDGSIGKMVTFITSETDGTEVKPDDGQEEETKNSELKVDVNIIMDRLVYYSINYNYPENYEESSDCLSAGLCYGKTPHPTIYDNTTTRQVIPQNGISGSVLPDLEPNTTYYIRPYTISSRGVVTYHNETSFATIGRDAIDAHVSIEGNVIKYSYSIKLEGTWNIKINWCNYVKGRSLCLKDFGYHKFGDSDSGSLMFSYDWVERDFIEIRLVNILTNQNYVYTVYK